MSEQVCARLRMIGRVQGVFFRQSTREMAEQIGLAGWVRNCPDGSVEALFVGSREQVDRAIAWCRQGPPAAAVDDLETTWEDLPEREAGFRIRY